MFLSISTVTGVKEINVYELQTYKSIDDESGKYIYYIMCNGITFSEYFDTDADRDAKLEEISNLNPGGGGGGDVPANMVTTNTSQTISGKKTFSTLPESNTLPTTDNQLVPKKYVDDFIVGNVFINDNIFSLNSQSTSQEIVEAFGGSDILDALIEGVVAGVKVATVKYSFDGVVKFYPSSVYFVDNSDNYYLEITKYEDNKYQKISLVLENDAWYVDDDPEEFTFGDVLFLPPTLLLIDTTYTSAQIVEALGGESKVNELLSAVDNGDKAIFGSGTLNTGYGIQKAITPITVISQVDDSLGVRYLLLEGTMKGAWAKPNILRFTLVQTLATSMWTCAEASYVEVSDFDPTQVSGYAVNKTQTLKNINGSLVWVDDSSGYVELTQQDRSNLSSILGSDEYIDSDLSETDAINRTDEIIGGNNNE